MNRDAERTADSPIGQSHVFTVTVDEFERQLGLRGETGGKSATSGTSEMGRTRECSRSDVFGTSNPELRTAPVLPEMCVRTRVFPQLARYLFRYTSHYAIARFLTDAVPCPHDVAHHGDAFLHPGPSDQVRPVLLSGRGVDVRSLPGAEWSGLRSGIDRLFD